MHFCVRVVKVSVEPENIGVVDILARRHLLQHFLLPTGQTLQRPPQFRIIYFAAEVQIRFTDSAGSDQKLTHIRLFLHIRERDLS